MFRGACFFHVFLDGIFSKFEPKMVPKLDTWRDTLRHRSVFFVTWFLQARRAPPLRISVVFRLPFECVLFDLGVHFGHCRIPPRDHFGIELQEFFWKLFIIRRCYLHVSLTPATTPCGEEKIPSPATSYTKGNTKLFKNNHNDYVWHKNLFVKDLRMSQALFLFKGSADSRRDNNYIYTFAYIYIYINMYKILYIIYLRTVFWISCFCIIT